MGNKRRWVPIQFNNVPVEYINHFRVNITRKEKQIHLHLCTVMTPRSASSSCTQCPSLLGWESGQPWTGSWDLQCSATSRWAMASIPDWFYAPPVHLPPLSAAPAQLPPQWPEMRNNSLSIATRLFVGWLGRIVFVGFRGVYYQVRKNWKRSIWCDLAYRGNLAGSMQTIWAMLIQTLHQCKPLLELKWASPSFKPVFSAAECNYITKPFCDFVMNLTKFFGGSSDHVCQQQCDDDSEAARIPGNSTSRNEDAWHSAWDDSPNSFHILPVATVL